MLSLAILVVLCAGHAHACIDYMCASKWSARILKPTVPRQVSISYHCEARGATKQ